MCNVLLDEWINNGFEGDQVMKRTIVTFSVVIVAFLALAANTAQARPRSGRSSRSRYTSSSRRGRYTAPVPRSRYTSSPHRGHYSAPATHSRYSSPSRYGSSSGSRSYSRSGSSIRNRSRSHNGHHRSSSYSPSYSQGYRTVFTIGSVTISIGGSSRSSSYRGSSYRVSSSGCRR